MIVFSKRGGSIGLDHVTLTEGANEVSTKVWSELKAGRLKKYVQALIDEVTIIENYKAPKTAKGSSNPSDPPPAVWVTSDMNAKDGISFVADLEEVSDLEAIVKHDGRATVKAAAKARLEALSSGTE